MSVLTISQPPVSKAILSDNPRLGLYRNRDLASLVTIWFDASKQTVAVWQSSSGAVLGTTVITLPDVFIQTIRELGYEVADA